MNKEKLIPIEQLCLHYEVETSLFHDLQEFDRIEILSIEETYFIHEDTLNVVEKVVRMQKDLNINLEGVDVILNLLDQVNELQTELNMLKNKLRIYDENED